ncbi:hypothetical protein QYF61_008773 [Mycteria americana]|uniref:Endonuclease/exonuclease/phosphatase domain-containing protein n=1 Tax=Mycteria americana TaxID=33587 RepID=A0AAN7NGB1_MYCAM|nr:hypothetical protein QYF61_008772 [Mycteria americana]KAK4810801.1 hypothetical protein QYF61_008773 [Mycteria americana]
MGYRLLCLTRDTLPEDEPMEHQHYVNFILTFDYYNTTNDGPCDSRSPGLEGCDWGSDKLPADFELAWDLLLQLNAHKSMGPDGIHPRVLKELADVIARPLSVIYQRSWESGEVPVDWKLANVIPIFKKGQRDYPAEMDPLGPWAEGVGGGPRPKELMSQTLWGLEALFAWRARGGGERKRDVESASEDARFRVLPDLTMYGQRSHRVYLRKGLATARETPRDHPPPPAPAQKIENFLEQEPSRQFVKFVRLWNSPVNKVAGQTVLLSHCRDSTDHAALPSRDRLLSGEGDKTRLARDKPVGGTPIFEGRCASEVLRSAVSVEVGDGDPCGIKDERVVDALETTEVPENSHIGIRASPPKNVAGSIAQQKSIYTNARSMGNKQEEPEAIVQLDSYDIVAITETWWDDSHKWSAAMDGYKLFRRDRQGRRGGGVALYVRDGFDCLELDDGDERVECLWVRVRGKGNKADITVGVCYGPPNQDEEADEIFYKQLGEVSRSLALVLVGDFNSPGVCWKYNTAERKQSRRFLECVADNFLTQLVSEPTREGAPPGPVVCEQRRTCG